MPELSLRYIQECTNTDIPLSSPSRTSVPHAGLWNLVLGPFDELTRILHFAEDVANHRSSDRGDRL